MKWKQSALMPGTEDKVGYWLTPPELMKALDDEFHFDYDACPFPRPAGFDGLKEEWGQRTWCNPPFTDSLTPWSRKAVNEANKGKLVVIILPISSSIEILMEAGAEFRSMGRVPWCRPDGTRASRSRWPSGLFILRGNIDQKA